MIGSIIEAVSIALDEEFGDGYEIYKERLEQDLEAPCFFVFCLGGKTEQFLGKRYLVTLPICIQYFPGSDEEQTECSDVAERLYRCLEYVTIYGEEKPIRGAKMHHELEEGVLNFFVSYDLFVIRQEQETPLETLEESATLKEGG